MPLAFLFGLLAALLDFVPNIGPIIAAVPAVLLTATTDPGQALSVVLLYIAVQAFEGYILEPLIQQRAVDLPPALLLFAIVAGALVFGPPGVIFAAPLTVVLFVTVKRLYVRDALGTPTQMPGERKA